MEDNFEGNSCIDVEKAKAEEGAGCLGSKSNATQNALNNINNILNKPLNRNIYGDIAKYVHQLTSVKQFCLRIGKVPYIKNIGKKGYTSAWSNKAGWLSFKEAVKAFENGTKVGVKDLNGIYVPHPVDGIGFIVNNTTTKGLHIIGGDIDCCRDPISGELSSYANHVLETVQPFYWEPSISLCGVRFFCYGTLGEINMIQGHDPQDDLPDNTKKNIIAVKPKVQEKLAKGENPWNNIEIYENALIKKDKNGKDIEPIRHLTLSGLGEGEGGYPPSDRTDALKEIMAPLIANEAEEKEIKETFQAAKKTKRNHKLPDLDILKVIRTSNFRKEGNRLIGPHPILGSTTGSNLVIDVNNGIWAYMHNKNPGTAPGGDAWTWLACECGAVNWISAGKGSLNDPDVMHRVKEYAINKGYFTKGELDLDQKKNSTKSRDPKSIIFNEFGNELNKHPSNQIFLGDNNEGYLWLAEKDGTHRNCIKMGTESFYMYLFELLSKTTGKWTASDRTVKDMDLSLKTLGKMISEKKGFKTNPKIFYQIGRVDSTLWYDLNRSDWKGVKIMKDGWTIETLPIGFVRPEKFREQVMPKSGGNLDDIFKYVHIIDERDKALYKADLITSFIEGIEHPISYFSGPKGSTKSTNTKIMVDLINPIELNSDLLNWNDSNIIEIGLDLTDSACQGVDNMSVINKKMANTLCQIVTGGKKSKRKFYTNGEKFDTKYRAKVVMNGITQCGINFPDLMDRMIMYDLATPKKRTNRDEVLAKYNENKPCLLGAIFDCLVNALQILEEVRDQGLELPRLGDFGLWGESISQSNWQMAPGEFLEIYAEKRKMLSKDTVESNEVAQAILIMMKDSHRNERELDTSAEELLSMLRKTFCNTGKYPSKFWPKNGQKLSEEINKIVGDLKSYGIEIERYKDAEGRHIKITYSPLDASETTSEG